MCLHGLHDVGEVSDEMKESTTHLQGHGSYQAAAELHTACRPDWSGGGVETRMQTLIRGVVGLSD